MANTESVALIGRRVEQAKEIIDVDYLLDLISNQEAEWSREVRVRKWRALAGKLGVGNVGNADRDMLLKMQQYVPVTPHALRCPCAQWLEFDTIGDHFPGSDLVPALEIKEKLLGRSMLKCCSLT